MVKVIYVLFLTSFLLGNSCFSQSISKSDSLKNEALLDVKLFKLNKADLIIFRKAGRNNFRSDYFKPNKANVRDTTLLKDSIYVQAFREAAFLKTRKRRTVGHYLAVGGLAYIGIVTVVAIGVVLFGLKSLK